MKQNNMTVKMLITFGYVLKSAVLLLCINLRFSVHGFLRENGANVCKTGSIYHCCRGWVMRDRFSRECTRAVCRYDCGSGKCIRPDICLCPNGRMETQCSILKDEDRRYVSSSCERLNCQHVCREVYSRYVCLCEPGYRMNKDGRTCRDVDECIENSHRCEHLCINTIGSHVCSCKQGYELKADKRGCQLTESSRYYYVRRTGDIKPPGRQRQHYKNIKYSYIRVHPHRDPYLKRKHQPEIVIPYRELSVQPMPSENIDWVLPDRALLTVERIKNLNALDVLRNPKMSYDDYKIRNRLILPDHPRRAVKSVLRRRYRDYHRYVPSDVVDKLLVRNKYRSDFKRYHIWDDSTKKSISGKVRRINVPIHAAYTFKPLKNGKASRLSDRYLGDEAFSNFRITQNIYRTTISHDQSHELYTKSPKKLSNIRINFRVFRKSHKRYKRNYDTDNSSTLTTPIRVPYITASKNKWSNLKCADGLLYLNERSRRKCRRFLRIKTCKDNEVIVVVSSGSQCFPKSQKLLGINCSMTQAYVLTSNGFSCIELSPGGIVAPICKSNQIARQRDSTYRCLQDKANSGCPEKYDPLSTFEGIICNHRDRCAKDVEPKIFDGKVYCSLENSDNKIVCPPGKVAVQNNGEMKCLNPDTLYQMEMNINHDGYKSSPAAKQTSIAPASNSSYCPKGQVWIKTSQGYSCRYKEMKTIKQKKVKPCPDGMILVKALSGNTCRFSEGNNCPRGTKLVGTEQEFYCEVLDEEEYSRKDCPEGHVQVKLPKGLTCLQFLEDGIKCPENLKLVFTKNILECKDVEPFYPPVKCSNGNIAYKTEHYTLCIDQYTFKVVLSTNLYCAKDLIPIVTPFGDQCVDIKGFTAVAVSVLTLKLEGTDKNCPFGQISVLRNKIPTCESYNNEWHKPCSDNFEFIWLEDLAAFLCVHLRDRRVIFDPWSRKYIKYTKTTKQSSSCPPGLVPQVINGSYICVYSKKPEVIQAKPNTSLLCPQGLTAVRTNQGYQCQYKANIHSKTVPCKNRIHTNTLCKDSVQKRCQDTQSARACNSSVSPEPRRLNYENVPSRFTKLLRDMLSSCSGNSFEKLICERRNMQHFIKILDSAKRDKTPTNRVILSDSNWRRQNSSTCKPGYIPLKDGSSKYASECVPRVQSSICSKSSIRNALLKGRSGCGSLHKLSYPVAICTHDENSLCKLITRPLTWKLRRGQCKLNYVTVRTANGTSCIHISRIIPGKGLTNRTSSCKPHERLIVDNNRFVCVPRSVDCVPKCENGKRCINGLCACEAGLTGPNCDIDVNECYKHTPCSHTCHNTHRGYTCLCPRGMKLGHDLHTCRKVVQ